MEAEKRLEPVSYEAEWAYLPCYDDLGKKSKPIVYVPAPDCSGRMKISRLGGREENFAEWSEVYSEKGGNYEMTIFYSCDKNRKLEYDEATMMRLIKRLGFKNVTEFYQRIADGGLDVNEILDKYVEQQKRDSDTHDEIVYRSAEGYNLQAAQQEETTSKEDVLVIDQNLKGLEFKLAKCCNPIYGDDVFGFVTVSGGIKIHRADCPNANQMRERFGYRIVKARWAGKSVGTQYRITLRVVGHDDIGIVTNITSIISKENGITLRSIGIDSNDGLFSGTLTVMVGDTGRLEALIKKLRTIKGVKQVSRN